MKVVKPIEVTSAVLVSSTALESVNPWSASTAYSAGQQVLRSNTRRIYQRILPGTTSAAPEMDKTNWLDLQPSNTWAMFDSEISTQTVANNTLSVVLKPGYANSLALFGLVGNAMSVEVRDGLGGPVVCEKSLSLDGTVISDYYQYFFEPQVQRTSVVLTDLPPYLNAHITITISGVGEVRCGVCLVGTFYELGNLQYGATSSIIDYSKKDTDVFGVTTFVKRAFSKRIGINLIFKNAQLLKLDSVLSGLRATPCAWIGTDISQLEVLNVFGFYKDFTVTIAYPTESLCSLEIEGLT